MKKRVTPYAMIIVLLISISCQKINNSQKKGFLIKGVYSEEDVNFFTNFFKQMEEAVRTEDLEKSISFYSKDFMSDEGINLEQVKENTEFVYEHYDNINYKMSNIIVTLKNDKAVSIDNFEYSAEPVKESLKPLEYKGTERIYWKKEGDEWKIINWVVSEE